MKIKSCKGHMLLFLIILLHNLQMQLQDNLQTLLKSDTETFCSHCSLATWQVIHTDCQF